jgi:hypothetical protein
MKIVKLVPDIIFTSITWSVQKNYLSIFYVFYFLHFVSCLLYCIIIIIIYFMQGIYTYIPETNYVPREYSDAAILLLLFMVLISLVWVLNLL